MFGDEPFTNRELSLLSEALNYRVNNNGSFNHPQPGQTPVVFDPAMGFRAGSPEHLRALNYLTDKVGGMTGWDEDIEWGVIIETKEPSSEWQKGLDERGFSKNFPFTACPDLEPLKSLLLGIAGHAVILPEEGEPELEEILTRGRLWAHVAHGRISGKTGRCHQNAAKYYTKESAKRKPTARGTFHICTGYALSYDGGAWRQHSWILKNNRLLESTVEFIAYYGVALTEEESIKFTRRHPDY